MSRQAESAAGRKGSGRRSGRRSGRAFRIALVVVAALAGCYIGFNLPEEKKNRAIKLMSEAREMPFRLFV